MSNTYIITVVANIYQLSQSVARQKIKDFTIANHNGNKINLTITTPIKRKRWAGWMKTCAF
ncbi:hypothetical protein, partial [Klebsiella pneumoniae]